jgi:hypothetical protein
MDVLQDSGEHESVKAEKSHKLPDDEVINNTLDHWTLGSRSRSVFQNDFTEFLDG